MGEGGVRVQWPTCGKSIIQRVLSKSQRFPAPRLAVMVTGNNQQGWGKMSLFPLGKVINRAKHITIYYHFYYKWRHSDYERSPSIGMLSWIRARICKPFKKPRNRFPAGGLERQLYLMYRPARLQRVAETIPWNRFLLLRRLQIRAQNSYIFFSKGVPFLFSEVLADVTLNTKRTQEWKWLQSCASLTELRFVAKHRS